MRRLWILLFCIFSPLGITVAEDENRDHWKTYRSEKYGYELSFPSTMKYVVYFDGSSGELVRTDTGDCLAMFEVWPPSKCSVSKEERTAIAAKEIGIRRAGVVTQADGPGGSSYCGDPLTIREVDSSDATRIYELELSCINEEYQFEDDDETDAEGIPELIDAEPEITFVGIKGPTYFVDISQPWLKRVLMVDPAGVDPRQSGEKDPEVTSQLRKILETIQTFPVIEPAGICIQDLR